MSGGPVTKIVDRCRHTVTTAGNDGGLPGLARAQIPGRPTCLTTAQRLQVKEAVRQCPRALGYHMSLWRTKLVHHFIYTRFGIEYCRERVRQLLHALVFRLRRKVSTAEIATAEDSVGRFDGLSTKCRGWSTLESSCA
jgi:transposase